MKVKVQVVPVRGDTIEKEVSVEATGASVKEVFEKAGVSSDNMKIAIDGNPVTDMNTHVPSGATVSLTERVRGS